MPLPRRENTFANGQLMGKSYKDKQEGKISTVTRNTIVTWQKYRFVHNNCKSPKLKANARQKTDCDDSLIGKQN